MLLDKLQDKSLILGSQSPRRKELITAMGLPFTIRLKPVAENYPPHLTSTQIAEHIAKIKAEAFTNDSLPEEIIITGDTIVWHNNKALGKPKNKQEAVAMINSLSNTSHLVISAIALMHKGTVYTASDVAEVTFRNLSLSEINYYVDTYNPLDKAGGYGIQEWIGHIGLQKLEGSYNTVMGLPTHLLYDMLSQLVDH